MKEMQEVVGFQVVKQRKECLSENFLKMPVGAAGHLGDVDLFDSSHLLRLHVYTQARAREWNTSLICG